MSSNCPSSRSLHTGFLAVVLAITASHAQGAAALRVCADPDNLPFSNDRMEGFENKIAELVAHDLKTTVSYTWHPERRGFIRDTLKAEKCDVIINVPTGYEPVLSTRPYFRSSYVFVTAENSRLDLKSFDEPALKGLKIGLHVFGSDGANSPPAHALARRGMVDNIVGFTILDTDNSPPGDIIDAVAKGAIDVAIVWGPFAGYFARKEPVALKIQPVASDPTGATQSFVFDMSMGVRRGDLALKAKLEDVMDRRQHEITKILESYGVPLVDEATPSFSPTSAIPRQSMNVN